MVTVRGRYQLPDRDDIAPVHFYIAPNGHGFIATVWTEDRRLDKVARTSDMRAETLAELEALTDRLARGWLESECKMAGT